MVVLVGLMLQNLRPDAQGTPAPLPEPSAPRDPALDRVRARLDEPPPLIVLPAPSLFSRSPRGRPLFAVRIESGMQMPPWDWTDDGTSVPDYVRPTFPPTHHEFMLMVTPEEFRGFSTHPYGVPVLSIARVIAKAARKHSRRLKEARARQEVQEALAALAAATAKREDRQPSRQP
jgi:hypothetical protein